MGLFRKKEQKEAEPEKTAAVQTVFERLQAECESKQKENQGLEERVKVVKEEYDQTISNLMMVKKELNEKKALLDATRKEHQLLAERMQKSRTHDHNPESDRAKVDLLNAKQELEEMQTKRHRIRQEQDREEAGLIKAKKQLIDLKIEIEKSSSMLERQRQAEEVPQKAVVHKAGKEGVMEAASAVVGSLNSKLNSLQKELEIVHGMLEKERSAHAGTKKELDGLMRGL